MFSPQAFAPSWGSPPKSCSWWPGSEESAALGRTCVTCGMAVLMDHHCPLCLGTFSLWLDCILSHYYWFGTLG